MNKLIAVLSITALVLGACGSSEEVPKKETKVEKHDKKKIEKKEKYKVKKENKSTEQVSEETSSK